LFLFFFLYETQKSRGEGIYDVVQNQQGVNTNVLFFFNVLKNHLNIDPVLKRLAERLAAIGDGADI